MIEIFINETYSDLPKSQCDRCRNNDICKWQDELIEVNTNINNIAFTKDLPITISVDCKRFIKKETKRETF